MTPQEIAARLPELTGGPHDDDTITALAQITAEAVRALNHATFPRPPSASPPPCTGCWGNWPPPRTGCPSSAPSWPAGWTEENTAGRLADDTGTCPAPWTTSWPGSTNAPRYAALLGGALDDAQQATAGLYRPGGGGEDQ